MAVAITRAEPDAAGLRQAASRTKDADAARRMLALAFVLDGRSRLDAARSCGMDRQTLRDWVHRFNERGLAGLSDRKAPGPMPRLTPEQNAAVAELVRKGPDLAEHGVAGWHKPGGRLSLPGNVSTLTLPAYAPELNPQENIWQFLRQNYLANRVFDTYDHIVQACCTAWNALMQQPERITTIATREWAKTVNV